MVSYTPNSFVSHALSPGSCYFYLEMQKWLSYCVHSASYYHVCITKAYVQDHPEVMFRAMKTRITPSRTIYLIGTAVYQAGSFLVCCFSIASEVNICIFLAPWCCIIYPWKLWINLHVQLYYIPCLCVYGFCILGLCWYALILSRLIYYYIIMYACEKKTAGNCKKQFSNFLLLATSSSYFFSSTSTIV
jgi:hypothetical protein